ncbi:MAG: bifunctional glutamate N-acetyltransferase/amino-acid acetyltransferase ArgJ [Chloroflexi bacterium]|nr:bifunctional glutamate N-acetyltransferase/amino-acid acetyltransferase ArgJ [Chloroflexota bacterium]MYF80269.1 bifunctional glutamate N-acetyltransferase/amino-acid acetyltransferase ArgJ [Chloroflexota bacterium]MYI03907.1 bifunctional glutamate N-acetyltransferase/amino-acid acetyltransferase ArgJ [Chloroflexota bacterium]
MSENHDALGANSEAEGAVTRAQGFSACGFTAGIKESGLPDLALLVSDRPASTAAVYTQNQSTAAPVHISKAHTANGSLRAAVVNSGNANCATGEQGLADAREMTQLTASLIDCEADDVFVNSTGIIGHYLPMDLLRSAIPQLQPVPDGGADFARSIMTTDTFQKEAVATFEAHGVTYAVGGCAKGAGMIHPDMATMLSFFTTDAPVPADSLDACFRYAMDRSFNMVTIDGDTSTNDSAVILANGAAGGEPLTGKSLKAFDSALLAVSTALAKMMARDGEGATKRISITVSGTKTWEDARDVARTIAVSPLLKAALSKYDPNWGRILMAAGRAGVAYDLDRVRIWISDLCVFDGTATGVPEEEASAKTQGAEVFLRMDLGEGKAEATAWGCDLTEEYVRFNADYVT